MDRRIIYQDQIPLVDDQLLQQRWTLTGLGWLAQTILGTATRIDGLACTPTAPASMQVAVAAGAIMILQQVDPLAYGDLTADTTHQIIKQGLVLDPTLLSCPAPATGGFSVNYLVQIGFAETDTDATLLQYYNPTNPASPYSGAAGDGQPDNTRRADQCLVQVKAGIAAATGTQVTPAPDPGFIGAYSVTVANGQTTITTPSIAQLASAPFIPAKLPDIPPAIQSGSWVYAPDQGSANTYVIAPKPTITAYVDGMLLRTRARQANTGAATLQVQGLSSLPIQRPDAAALTGGEIQAGHDCLFFIAQGAAQLINPAWTRAANSWPKEQVLGAVVPSSSFSAGYRCRLAKEEPPVTRELSLQDISYTLYHTDTSSISRYEIGTASAMNWLVGAIIWFQNGRGAANLKITPDGGVNLFWGNSNVGERTLPDSAQCGIQYMGSDTWWVIDDRLVT